MSKHTPGPWVKIDGDLRGSDGSLVRIAGSGIALAMEANPRDAAVANGRLIAAAPDLLRVAELLVDWLDEEEGAHALCDTARAAIAKATGGEP